MNRSMCIAVAILMLSMLTTECSAGMQPQDPQPEMKVPPPTSGFLGVKFGIVDDETAEKLGLSTPGGMIVIEFFESSPAEKAGLKEEDVILKIDAEEIADRDAFIEKMSTTMPGQVITITIMRDKQEQDVDVTLGERPKNFPSSQPTTKPG